MNKLPLHKRTQILSMLVEGSSMRSISRVVGVSINTVTKILVEAGEACAAYHDETVRNVEAARVQCDEIWSFTAAKQKNVKGMKAPVEGAGDIWTWTAFDTDSKLIVSYLVGGRDACCANAFSKKIDNHLHMLSLYFVHYNFCCIHKTLKVSPAMAAGVSDRLRDVEWIVSLIDARAEKPNRPARHKKIIQTDPLPRIEAD